jgi:hypothetical protein
LQSKDGKQVHAERERIMGEESKKARQAAAAELDSKARELADMQDVLKTRDAKLAEAQQAQAELIKKQRQLDDEKRELELTVEKRVQDSITEARTVAKQEAATIRQQFEQQLAEKDQTMAQREQGLRNKEAQLLEQLKNKRLRVISEESQKAKLAVAAELENMLQLKFPFDSIEPVAKGEFGGDALQRVISSTGNAGGTILWRRFNSEVQSIIIGLEKG